LVALVDDSIGDVVEIERSLFESPPDTIPAEVRRFIKGIYKMNGQLMSVIDLGAIEKEFSPNTDPATTRIN
jgi:purine-binding chemotaxis protein CheW